MSPVWSRGLITTFPFPTSHTLHFVAPPAHCLPACHFPLHSAPCVFVSHLHQQKMCIHPNSTWLPCPAPAPPQVVTWQTGDPLQGNPVAAGDIEFR